MNNLPKTLNIPAPCNQSWQTMTSTPDGRFCTQCAKTVVDFTRLSDAEIQEQLTNASGKICGRFIPQQLNRPLNPEPSVPAGHPVYRLLAGLFLLGTVRETALAQTTVQAPPAAVHNSAFITIASADSEPVSVPKKVLVMQGGVYQKGTNVPLPGVQVFIRDTQMGVATNDSGRFSLLIPDGQLMETITVRFSYIGFVGTEIRMLKSELPLVKDIYLEPDKSVIMGEVVIIRRKRKWWQPGWRSLFSSASRY
nr:carboxypeptidase-like regulatory domain-containing protein [uncultured Arsenicibacter sp.]